MSTLRTVNAPNGDDVSASSLGVMRFNMGVLGTGLQLLIGERYVQLTPEQRLEFYAVLGELFGTPPPASMSGIPDNVSCSSSPRAAASFDYAASDAYHHVIDVLERVERDPDTHPLATDDATTLIRASQQARQLHTRIGKVMMGDPPPEPTGPVITRDEAIEMLRGEHHDPDDPRRALDGLLELARLREWLCEQLDISDDDLAPQWWQLTLSRGALTELRGIWTNMSGEMAFAFADELTKALANARPEEDADA